MGGGMAKTLLSNSSPLTCYDPNDDVLTTIRVLGAKTTNSAGDLAKISTIIILSLPKAAVVDAVMHEILPHIQTGTIILDTSTSEPTTSQAMSAVGLNRSVQSLINGQLVNGKGADVQLVDPYTKEILCTYQDADASLAGGACIAAQAVQSGLFGVGQILKQRNYSNYHPEIS